MKNMTPEILYEDNHLLVVAKPSGLLTQPSGTELPSLEALCKKYLKKQKNSEGNIFLHAVHRLDRQASGIIVFAKTSKALTRLNDSIRKKEAKKLYTATVEGCPLDEEAILEHFLVHGDRKAHLSDESNVEAKKARLHYRIVDRSENTTTLLIELETGRYHQIRAQLAAIGCPILGDHKYGSNRNYQPDAIALHHCELHIEHPTTKVTLILKST